MLPTAKHDYAPPDPAEHEKKKCSFSELTNAVPSLIVNSTWVHFIVFAFANFHIKLMKILATNSILIQQMKNYHHSNDKCQSSLTRPYQTESKN